MPVLYDDATQVENKPTNGPLSELEAYSDGVTLFFPEDLPTLDHWVAFRIAKDVKFRRDEVRKEDTEMTIILPMPQNIGTGYAAEYSNPALGPLGGFGAGLGSFARAQSGQDPSDIAEAIVNKVNSTPIQDLVSKTKYGLLNLAAQGAAEGAGALVGGLLGGLGGLGLGAAAGGAVTGALAGAGIAANPGIATLFTGVNFRTHRFSYRFVPRSKAESDKLKEIIFNFKFAMMPDYLGENHFFDYPNQFDIEFHYPKYLFDIGASVLTSFDVNYSTEGGSYFFDNEGAPVSVTIDMSFQELTIITKDKIREFK